MANSGFEILGFLLLLFLFLDVSLDELCLCIVSDVFNEHNKNWLTIPDSLLDLYCNENLLCKLI